MLETIAGLVPAASGEATAPARTRFYAEDAWVFSTSVRENLRVGTPELDDTLATRVLSAVGFPFDLDFVLDNGADSLSAGQRRRLLLARALCSDADVLLLDEPTAHLTPRRLSRSNAHAAQLAAARAETATHRDRRDRRELAGLVDRVKLAGRPHHVLRQRDLVRGRLQDVHEVPGGVGDCDDVAG